ncbi:MAG: hypothetical protein GXX10_05885 [Clostridiaceae bacterium]|nr:hypothetical protein [Clostridiaceae bacterium]
MPRVIGGFKCPYTGRIYHVGDEYDGEHIDEMRAKGYIEGTNEERNGPEPSEKPKKPKKSKE